MKKFLALFLLACMTSFLYADDQVSAASSFTLKGISSMKMEVLNRPDERQVLAVTSQVVFENFTAQTLGGVAKAQPIRLTDLRVTVYIVDTRDKPLKQTIVDDDGTVVVIEDFPRKAVGKGKINDLWIPAEVKEPIALPLTIVNDFTVVEKGQTSMETKDFERLLEFTNLFTGTQDERKWHRLLLVSSCKVAIQGENGAWVWDRNEYYFSWALKSSNQSGLVLECEESRVK
ncbi:MAG: hypothetical protein IKO65_02580 [Victivallales bacterium]|nr:hypothetical protein [Victivallales bacterium]